MTSPSRQTNSNESAHGTPLIISIVSGKGGVGKSSISLCIAHELSLSSKVLFIDLDYFNRGATGLLETRLEPSFAPEETSFLCTVMQEQASSEINTQIHTVSNREDFYFCPSASFKKESLQKIEAMDIHKLETLVLNEIKNIANNLEVDCVVIDSHGGPDPLSIIVAAISDHLLIIGEPDKVTIHGVLNYLSVIEDFSIKSPLNGKIHLVFNNISRYFNIKSLEDVHQIIVDSFKFKPHIYEHLNCEQPLAYIPFEEEIRQHFGDAPFITELLPDSIFSQKIRTIVWDLYPQGRSKLELNEKTRNISYAMLEELSWARPKMVSRLWRITYVLLFAWIILLGLSYISGDSSFIVTLAQVTFLSILGSAGLALANSTRLLRRTLAKHRRFASFNSEQQEYAKRSISSSYTIVIIAVGVLVLAAILLPALARAKEAARTASCANNLKQMGLIFKMYANENKGERYPALSPIPGNFSPSPLDSIETDDTAIYPEYLYDLSILSCPSDTTPPSPEELIPPETAPPILSSASYYYFGYLITNESEGLAFIDEYRKRVYQGIAEGLLTYDKEIGTHRFPNSYWSDNLTLPAHKGVADDNQILRFQEGIERFIFTDINPVYNDFGASTIPLMFDAPIDDDTLNHTPNSANILYMDGHVELHTFDDPHTLFTPKFINAIVRLQEEMDLLRQEYDMEYHKLNSVKN